MSSVKHSPDSDGAPLNDKLLLSITNHLNKDHLEDMLACAKGVGGLDWVEQAKVTSLDAAGINLEVSGANKIQPLRLDFPQPAGGVLASKRMLGAMIAQGRSKLGWEKAVDEH